jgi:hypothetical protein
MLLGRNGKLDLTATIRSNDIMRGVKYDYALASFMQQSIASWVNLEPGKLYFSINSLHTYNKDAGKLEEIVKELETADKPIDLVIPGNIKSEDYWNDFRRVKKVEEATYNGAWDYADEQIDKISIPIFRDFSRIFAIKNAKHNKKQNMVRRYTGELEIDENKRWLK